MIYHTLNELVLELLSPPCAGTSNVLFMRSPIYFLYSHDAKLVSGVRHASLTMVVLLCTCANKRI